MNRKPYARLWHNQKAFYKPSKIMKDIKVSRYNYDSTATATKVILIAFIGFVGYMTIFT